MIWFNRAATIAAATLITACSGDSTGPGGGIPVESLAVSPASLTLTVGSTGTLTAIPSAASGTILTGRTIIWTSTNNSVASVNNGVVTANAAGTVTITATSEGKSRNATVSVTTGITQATFSVIAPGGSHTCALDAAGKAWCWGANNLGAVGVGAIGGVFFIAQPVSGNLTFSSISSGMNHTCAQTVAGVAYCWGSNTHGQLGDGTNSDRGSPTPVSTALVFTSISAGGDAGSGHTCALTAAGAAHCWGRNFAGQLGDNSTTDKNVPVAVQGGLTFTSLSAGNAFTCGLSAQKAHCWGDNDEIGEGTANNRSVPTAVAGNPTFKSLFASWASSCGITLADAAQCWGFVSSSTVTTLPTIVPSLTFSSMAPGNMFMCGTNLAGAGYCWGVNNAGQVGDGSTASRATPVPVNGSIVFAKIIAGNGHTCGLTAAGLTYCWGGNTSGQLGEGTQVARLSPTAVRSPL